jgi:hypothetical protein
VLQNVFCQVVKEPFIYTSNTLATKLFYTTLLYSTLYVSGLYFSIALLLARNPGIIFQIKRSNAGVLIPMTNIKYFGLRGHPNACCYEKFASIRSQTKKIITAGCPELPSTTPCCVKLLRSRLRNYKEDIHSPALLTKTSPSLTIAVFALSIFISARKRYLGDLLC